VNTLDCGQYYVFGTLEIIGVLCQGTVIVCLYRQPSSSDLTLIDSLTEFCSSHSHHPLIVVGDFNVQEQEWLGSPYTSSAGSAFRGFCEAFGLRQLIDQGTRQGAVLDLIITEYAGSVTYHPHLSSSDHIGLFVKFNLNLHEPPPLVSRRVYHWAPAPWNHIHGHFRRIQWDVLRSGTVPEAVESFVDVFIKARDRYVSSTILKARRPTVRWDRFCLHSYQRKLEAWARRDWPAYHTAVSSARRAQAIAFRRHRRSLLNRLKSCSNDRSWWNLTKDISGFGRSCARFAPDVDALANLFTAKLSLPAEFNSTPPPLPPETSAVVYKGSWRVKLSKVRNVLGSLDVNKAVGPDGISPHMLRYCCNELCLPLTILFTRICRSGDFPSSWKVSRSIQAKRFCLRSPLLPPNCCTSYYGDGV